MPCIAQGWRLFTGLPWLLEVVLVNGSVASLAHLRYKTKVVFPWGKQPPGMGAEPQADVDAGRAGEERNGATVEAMRCSMREW